MSTQTTTTKARGVYIDQCELERFHRHKSYIHEISVILLVNGNTYIPKSSLCINNFIISLVYFMNVSVEKSRIHWSSMNAHQGQ